MARRRRKYTDKFRASALVLLESEGYPDRDGALMRVSRHLDVPESTLRGWWTEYRNPVSAEVRGEKTQELRDLFEGEIREAVRAMANARSDASYRDLGTVIGILTDKHQLLSGEPTSRAEMDVAASELMDMSDDELDALLYQLAADHEGAQDADRPTESAKQFNSL